MELAFGVEREKDGAAQRICRRGDRVVWVNASAVAKAATSAAEWRSIKLVSLESWNATKLEIAKGPDNVHLERREGIWKANGTEVDGGVVSRRLAAFADLEVSAFDRPKPAGPATGHIAVTKEDGGVVEATFYSGLGPSESIAVVAGRSGALAVDAMKAGELLADPSSLAKPKPPPPSAPATAPSAPGTTTPPAADEH